MYFIRYIAPNKNFDRNYFAVISFSISYKIIPNKIVRANIFLLTIYQNYHVTFIMLIMYMYINKCSNYTNEFDKRMNIV